jgi:hypothetical protein
MKASKFTDAQKAFIVKQGEEGTPVAEICRKAGISQATNFNWSAGGYHPIENCVLCCGLTSQRFT